MAYGACAQASCSTMTPELVCYKPEYKAAYQSLSYEWLREYVSVEPEDERILNDPEGVVLRGGGQIFFVLLGGVPVGTVSMIPAGEGVFELAKLAVTARFRGQKLGRLLMERAIAFARERGAKRILLYTNHKLTAALHLYAACGFREIPLGENKYLESDRKMELDLS